MSHIAHRRARGGYRYWKLKRRIFGMRYDHQSVTEYQIESRTRSKTSDRQGYYVTLYVYPCL